MPTVPTIFTLGTRVVPWQAPQNRATNFDTLQGVRIQPPHRAFAQQPQFRDAEGWYLVSPPNGTSAECVDGPFGGVLPAANMSHTPGAVPGAAKNPALDNGGLGFHDFPGTVTYPDDPAWHGAQGYVMFREGGNVPTWPFGEQDRAWTGSFKSPTISFRRGRTLGGDTLQIEIRAQAFQATTHSPIETRWGVGSVAGIEVWLGGTSQQLPVTAASPSSGGGSSAMVLLPFGYAGTVVAQAIDTHGQRSVKKRLYLAPVARAEVETVSETSFVVTPTDFDFDGSVVSGVTRYVPILQSDVEANPAFLTPTDAYYQPSRDANFRPIYNQTPIPYPNNGVVPDGEVFDASVFQQDDPVCVLVMRQVYDNGNYLSVPVLLANFVLPPLFSGFGITSDNSDALFTACPSGSGTQVYVTRGTIAERQSLALIPNTRAPSIWKDAHHRLWLHAQKNKSEWRLWFSDNNGRSFTESFMSWPTGQFTHGDTIGLKGGKIATLAVETSTKNLLFKTSKNEGLTWSPPVRIATLEKAQQFRLREKIEARSNELIATNSIDKQFRSENQGRTWPPN